MSEVPPQSGSEDPSFVAPARRRQRSAFVLSTLVVLVLFGFIFVMAFRPLWLAPAAAGGASSLGMWCGLVLILANCAVMGAYVLWRRGDDPGRGGADK